MDNVKVKIQRFGNSLSAMVMPNIGAFIAWGFLAALFIPAGYFPNEKLNELIAPTLTYVLPILIGYTAGYNIYGKRGGVAGALSNCRSNCWFGCNNVNWWDGNGAYRSIAN